jgi:hypothetical protein
MNFILNQKINNFKKFKQNIKNISVFKFIKKKLQLKKKWNLRYFNLLNKKKKFKN